MPGVPASDTSATNFPLFSLSIRNSAFCILLYSKKLVVGVLIPYLSRRIFVWRVSSQATRSTAFNTFIARSVMSARFPIGVETIYSVPGIVTKLSTGVGCTQIGRLLLRLLLNGNRLREIPRLINVAAALHSDVIGEKLQRQGRQ